MPSGRSRGETRCQSRRSASSRGSGRSGEPSVTQLPEDAVAASVHVTRPLEAAGIGYAIGGAVAYGYWGVPRATVDVDLNLFVDDAQLGAAIDRLCEGGAIIDKASALASSRSRGDFRGVVAGMRLDVFTPSIEFSHEAARTRVRTTLLDEPVWILSAEATAVFKLLFFRPKDILDLERLVAVQGDRVDVEYIRRWVVEMLGEGDERVARWDRIVDEHGARGAS